MPNNSLNYHNCKCNIDVMHLQSQDIPLVARLYKRSFQNHFLGHMGYKFLELFISEFVKSDANFGYAAKYKNEVIGFILATTSDNPFREFYRDNFMMLVYLTISRFLKDSFIRRHITKRLGHVHVALKALFSFSVKDNNSGEKREVCLSQQPRLLALAVDRSYRGLGIANELTAEFCKEMKELGFKKVGLSALPWNQRAISFYIKDGWKKEGASEASISFSRLL
ncbi:putative acetyltransferase [Desulfosporosinus acididurans]|uniref:Putative acetyltransferase n=2 Tax=Desulfosporosinus acididurans TaxID=476652 RepID=A0A0J1FKF8_9FIRM|nr:putative acetyltransferase [Desulfosporosinus acididurans]